MERGPDQTSVFLGRWHRGERAGLDALIERHLSWIKEQVRHRLTPQLRSKAETVDFIQDAVVQFLQYAPRFTLTDEEHFRALMIRVVESSLLNRYDWFMARRRRMSMERPLPNESVLSLDSHERKTPSQYADLHEKEAWVRLGLEFLEPDEREMIILRQWDGLPFAEIGERFDVSTDAARMRHNRAVDHLSDAIWRLRSGKLDQLLEVSA